MLVLIPFAAAGPLAVGLDAERRPSEADARPAVSVHADVHLADAARLHFRAGAPIPSLGPVRPRAPGPPPDMAREDPSPARTDWVSASIELAPVQLEVLHTPGRLWVGTGIGVTGTRDDLERLQSEDDPEALATEVQHHPVATWSTVLEVDLGPTWRARAGVTGWLWVETTKSSLVDVLHDVVPVMGVSVRL